MRATSNILQEFITDFGIDTSKDVICFDAVIYFSTNKNLIQLPSEVQIVIFGTNHIEIIYLLDPDVEVHKIPDVFTSDAEKFFYRKDLALIIKGYDAYHGEYVLSIHPGDRECDEATLQELHMKMYN